MTASTEKKNRSYKAKWAGQLGVLLIGQAQAAYPAMTRSDAIDYDKVKGEILRRLDITPERQRQAFQAKKPPEVKTPHILWQTLANLLSKWLRPESTSKEQILDLVLMEQFIDDLEEETQKWVRSSQRLRGVSPMAEPTDWERGPPELIVRCPITVSTSGCGCGHISELLSPASACGGGGGSNALRGCTCIPMHSLRITTESRKWTTLSCAT
uniref:SCAN box domain-containing protein n=1 Tax=Crocodylus porosus TaxID=8502 RepID=A0A7M4F9J8_CROPO